MGGWLAVLFVDSIADVLVVTEVILTDIMKNLNGQLVAIVLFNAFRGVYQNEVVIINSLLEFDRRTLF